MPGRFNEIVDRINQTLPVHSMWDGFWIHSFRGRTLTVSCSFNSIYYRNYDLIFKKVTFFNLPAKWRDTDIIADKLVRLSTKEEFQQHIPDFDLGDDLIFAIDLHFQKYDIPQKHTFFVVAKHIYLIECNLQDHNPCTTYVDLFKNEEFPCKQNRVVMKQEINRCEECKSEYFAGQSPMANLCPECSHVLYGTVNCVHIFENNRCITCGWNGKASKFITKLIHNSPKSTK